MNKTNQTMINRHDNSFSTFKLLDESDFGTLFNILSGDGFSNWWKNLFTKASDTISSLRMYPILRDTLKSGLKNNELMIGGTSWEIPNYDMGYHIDSYVVGSYDFPQATSFIDYHPYTSVHLYLPYVDFIELPINEIIGKHLEVVYAFDFSTGIVTIFINVGTLENKYTMATKSAKLGVDIAWGKDNSFENTRNIISTALQTAISVVATYVTKGGNKTLQAVGKVARATAITKGAISVVNSLQTQFTRGGLTGSMTGLMAPSHPYLIIKKKKLIDINEGEYAHTYGLPLYESRWLYQLTGFTIVDEIHLEGFTTALDEEVNEIERLLKTGVHL